MPAGPSAHSSSSFFSGHTAATTSRGACPVEEDATCATFVADHVSLSLTLMPWRSCHLQWAGPPQPLPPAGAAAPGGRHRCLTPHPTTTDATTNVPSGRRHFYQRPPRLLAAAANAYSGCRLQRQSLPPLAVAITLRAAVIWVLSFVGESMLDDGSLVFACYKDAATDPTFLYLAYGLKEIKC
ncbi:uncharacterized protein LOC122021847 isoform X1 [Zingiber officinale]|uniref:TCTP domain-containing protein n=1 Tax=Zingiber officinale TaxID=94328 RepID=A0A8J5HUB2_ZINOF|nr:uncharacterized protein LOC122021847 isoform X1 [Zingiber officinale]KAG6535976.1 hypothetical protein ZIOFF_001011 [Zingiber officinale]